MKCVIGIIGAGHAGVSAAKSASEYGATRIILLSNESVLPYFRPRLPALAFGQVKENEIVMHPPEWFAERNIELLLSCHVNEIRPDTMELCYNNGVERVDGIIIATGAQPFVPPALKQFPPRVTLLWNFQHAMFIRNNINSCRSLTIIGGGLIGIESALRATDVGLSVTLIERSKQMMAGLLCNKASKLLEKIMITRGIKMLFETTVTGMKQNQNNIVELQLNNGQVIETDMAIIAVGAHPNFTLVQQAGIATNNGVLVNNTLMTSHPRIFACGDVAVLNSKSCGSAAVATEQGVIAGANVCSSILGSLIRSYIPRTVQVSMKYGDFEIHCAGVAPSDNDEIKILTDDGKKFRAIFRKQGKITSIQMVGTSEEFGIYLKSLENAEQKS